MKLMYICKKHYKELMEEFKKTNPPESVEAVLNMPNCYINLIGLAGIDFQIHIVKYLKKIKIIDIPKFEVKPKPIEFKVEENSFWKSWLF